MLFIHAFKEAHPNPSLQSRPVSSILDHELKRWRVSLSYEKTKADSGNSRSDRCGNVADQSTADQSSGPAGTGFARIQHTARGIGDGLAEFLLRLSLRR